MSDTPGDDTRTTDPWGNPLPSGGQVPRQPPAPTPPQAPPPSQAPPPAQPPPAPGSQPPASPDAWWPGDPSAAEPTNQPGPPNGWAQPQPGAQPPPNAWGQPQPGGYPGYAPYPQAKNEGTAIGALVCGLVSLLCAGACGIVIGPAAIVLGIVSRRKIEASNGLLHGRGMSTAGIVLGIIGTALSVAALIVLAINPDIVNDIVDQLNTTTTTTPG